MKQKTKIIKKVKQYIKIRNELISFGSEEAPLFLRRECPLGKNRKNHYELNESIFGVGCYRWTCGFCGETEED